MSQSGESGSCSGTKGLEYSTVGASVMCELQVKVSGDSAHWHTECHYWPASCPSLTATQQKAKDIIIPYLNSSLQINISFLSFTPHFCNYSHFGLIIMGILIIIGLLLWIDLGEEINEYILPLLHSGIYEVYFHIIALCSWTNSTDSTVQLSIMFFALSLRKAMALLIIMSTYFFTQYIFQTTTTYRKISISCISIKGWNKAEHSYPGYPLMYTVASSSS